MHGAIYDDGRCRFSVWAPRVAEMALHIADADAGDDASGAARGHATQRLVPMERAADGTFSITLDDTPPGTLYYFRLGGARGHDRPDPASRHQPHGVHGPSAVVDTRAPGGDHGDRAALCAALSAPVIYELHVGTFSAEGTFDGAIAHLDRLRDLGVNTIELMPVAQFPGTRNWGYDGVYPYAVQHSYGGVAGLLRLVRACHRRGIAVLLDVVYNHLGPEGNYLSEYGPYFTDRYHTPWGAALNFDGPDSDMVRRFFIDSALYYLDACHVDGFRIDAVHAIVDTSARPFLQELTTAIHAHAAAQGRQSLIIGESDLNDPRVLMEPASGGLGMDAQWIDDFHHAVHAQITGERTDYYADFGALRDVATAYTHGYVYTGQYSAYRRRRHGRKPAGCSGSHFVVYTQNHDQIGNRALGDRLSVIVTPDQQKLLACALLLSPYVPLLFMGQEYGETAPFQYFTDHTDPALADAVRKGRRAEFSHTHPPDEIPDPQDEQTFLRSRLDWSSLEREPHRSLWRLHQELIALRRRLPALSSTARERTHAVVHEREQILLVSREHERGQVMVLFDMRPAGPPQSFVVPLPAGRWQKVLDTSTRDASQDAGEEGAVGIEPGSGHVVTLAASSCQVFATEPS